MNRETQSANATSHNQRGRKSLAALLAEVKFRLLHELSECYSRVMPLATIRRAIDEAAELARSTDFPHLFLPVLAEEKVHAVVASATDRNCLGRVA